MVSGATFLFQPNKTIPRVGLRAQTTGWQKRFDLEPSERCRDELTMWVNTLMFSSKQVLERCNQLMKCPVKVEQRWLGTLYTLWKPLVVKQVYFSSRVILKFAESKDAKNKQNYRNTVSASIPDGTCDSDLRLMSLCSAPLSKLSFGVFFRNLFKWMPELVTILFVHPCAQQLLDVLIVCISLSQLALHFTLYRKVGFFCQPVGNQDNSALGDVSI